MIFGRAAPISLNMHCNGIASVNYSKQGTQGHCLIKCMRKRRCKVEWWLYMTFCLTGCYMACLVGKDGNQVHRLRSPVTWPGKSADSRLHRIEPQFEVPSQARAGPCGSLARARAYIKKKFQIKDSACCLRLGKMFEPKPNRIAWFFLS